MAFALKAVGSHERVLDREVTWSNLCFNKVSVAVVLRLDKARKTGAVTQSTDDKVLGQGPAVQVVRTGRVPEIFRKLSDLMTTWTYDRK